MNHEVDSEIVITIANKILQKFGVSSWSFDKGFYSKENKELLDLFVDEVIMPKKGKLNKKEYEFEHRKKFKKLRNKHSAVESNIMNSNIEGLDRCPDKETEPFLPKFIIRDFGNFGSLPIFH